MSCAVGEKDYSIKDKIWNFFAFEIMWKFSAYTFICMCTNVKPWLFNLLLLQAPYTPRTLAIKSMSCLLSIALLKSICELSPHHCWRFFNYDVRWWPGLCLLEGQHQGPRLLVWEANTSPFLHVHARSSCIFMHPPAHRHSGKVASEVCCTCASTKITCVICTPLSRLARGRLASC